MRKIIALVLCTVMILTMALTAFAYSITITNTNTENITIAGKTYTAYKLFDMTYAGMSGTPDDPSGSGYAYSIDSDGDGAWAWNTLIANVTPDDKGVYVNTTYGLTFTPSAADSSVYAVTSTMTEAQAYDLAAALQNVAKTGAITYSGTVPSGAETVRISVADDQPGYYVVMGTADAKNDSGTEVTAAVSLTSTNPDVVVNPKADAPSVDKSIGNSGSSGTNGTAGEVGSDVNFVVNSKVPKDMNGYKSGTNPSRFPFRDTMSEGLTFDHNSVKVYINGTLLVVNDDKQEYDLVYGSDSAPYTFTLEIPDLTIYTPGAPIVIEYSATINDKALTTEKETNTVSLNYSNNPYNSGSSGNTPDDVVFVYEFDINIDKIDGKDSGTKLDGAEFVLRKASGSTYAYYTVDASGTVSWVAKQESGTVVTTDKSGTGRFNGLTSGTYQLVETKAPEGYNLLDEPKEFTIEVTFNEDGSIKETNTVYTSGSNHNHTLTVTVENNAGTLLPSTGGIGTTIFYIVGGLLAVGAGVVLVAKKRMGKVED